MISKYDKRMEEVIGKTTEIDYLDIRLEKYYLTVSENKTKLSKFGRELVESMMPKMYNFSFKKVGKKHFVVKNTFSDYLI